jgi:hypothetical protein
MSAYYEEKTGCGRTEALKAAEKLIPHLKHI